MKLNLGCGDDIRKGFINIDINKKKGVDLVLDLNNPLPFKENSIDYALCNHIIEHLENPINFILDLYWVCENGAIIEIVSPHFSSFTTHADLTHKRGLSYFSFGEKQINKEIYQKFDVNKKFNFLNLKYKWLNFLFNPIINLSPTLYERLFCYILPCSEIHFQLKVKK